MFGADSSTKIEAIICPDGGKLAKVSTSVEFYDVMSVVVQQGYAIFVADRL